MPTASTAKASPETPGSASDSRSPRAAASADPLLEIQLGMAGIFADLADLLGNPSSLGSIYGLLFASPNPLSMEEIVERLGISTGTASQGLRRLGELDAITPAKADGERVTRYTAKLELRPFVSAFLNQQLLPRLVQSTDLLVQIEQNLSELQSSEKDELLIRVRRAIKWHQKSSHFIPFIKRLLGVR